MQFKILEKYFQFELHTSESQDCSVQASQRLVSKKLHIEEQVQVEGYTTRSKNRNTSYNTLRKYTECLLSICYREHLEFWVV